VLTVLWPPSLTGPLPLRGDCQPCQACVRGGRPGGHSEARRVGKPYRIFPISGLSRLVVGTVSVGTG